VKFAAAPYSIEALLKPYNSSVSNPAAILGSANDEGPWLSKLLDEETSPHCSDGTSRYGEPSPDPVQDISETCRRRGGGKAGLAWEP